MGTGAASGGSYLPDVVLCDLKMPGMDGIACFEEIRRRWPELAERVIFMTGDTATLDSYEFLTALPNRVLEKPFGYTELVEAVQEAVGHR